MNEGTPYTEKEKRAIKRETRRMAKLKKYNDKRIAKGLPPVASLAEIKSYTPPKSNHWIFDFND